MWCFRYASIVFLSIGGLLLLAGLAYPLSPEGTWGEAIPTLVLGSALVVVGGAFLLLRVVGAIALLLLGVAICVLGVGGTIYALNSDELSVVAVIPTFFCGFAMVGCSCCCLWPLIQHAVLAAHNNSNNTNKSRDQGSVGETSALVVAVDNQNQQQSESSQ